MKRSNLIGGTICIAIAGLLAALYFILPEGDVSFMVDGKNMPWVPMVGLGILGLVLFATGQNGAEKAKEEQPVVVDEERARLNKRLEGMAWGLFLIMLGGFALVPDETIPKGAWSIGVGLIMLGLNLARYLNQIKMSGFTTFLGVLSLISGIAQLFGLHDFEGPFLLIILGAYVIIKPYFERRQLFGKAEEGPPSVE
jgi:hypothetical protein